MSQSGNLVFFSEMLPQDPKAILAQLLPVCAYQSISLASRLRIECSEWSDFVKSLNEPAESSVCLSNQGQDEELIRGPLGKNDLVALWEGEDWFVSIHTHRSNLGHRVSRDIECHVPERIRGSFIPSDLILDIGWHDLFECAENEEGHLFGRPFISIKFFGYGSPNDWVATRKMILELDEVKKIRVELEKITGPLETCVYWDI